MANAEVIQKWTEALRSGEYSQIAGSLKKVQVEGYEGPIGYCCLGVLCDLAAKEGIVYEVVIAGDYEISTRSYLDPTDSNQLSSAVLPNAVTKWAGLPTNNPWRLTAMNDNGDAFSDIADYIEKMVTVSERVA